MLSTLELVPAISPPTIGKVQVAVLASTFNLLLTPGANCLVSNADMQIAFGETYSGYEIALRGRMPFLFNVPASASRVWAYEAGSPATLSAYAVTGADALNYSVPFAPDYTIQRTTGHGVVDLGIHGATEMLVAAYEPCFIVFGAKGQEAELADSEGLPLYPDYPMRFKLDVTSTLMLLYGQSSSISVYFSYLGRSGYAV